MFLRPSIWMIDPFVDASGCSSSFSEGLTMSARGFGMGPSAAPDFMLVNHEDVRHTSTCYRYYDYHALQRDVCDLDKFPGFVGGHAGRQQPFVLARPSLLCFVDCAPLTTGLTLEFLHRVVCRDELAIECIENCLRVLWRVGRNCLLFRTRNRICGARKPFDESLVQ